MYSLINFHSALNRGEHTNLTLNRRMGTQEKAIANIVNFYRTYNNLGPSNSPLIRILYSLTLAEDKGPIEYYSHFKSELVPSMYGLTDESSKGTLIEDVFYGKAKVAILAESKAGISTLATNSWMDMEPLKVIRHPGLKQSLTRPDMSTYDEKDFAILHLDIGMLGFMYGCWIKINRSLPLEKRERPENFLCRYVYPNMLWSQYDQVLINSLIADYTDLDKVKDNPTPILTTDKSLDIVDDLRDLSDAMGDGITIEQFLENVPNSKGGSMIDSLVKPVSAATVQTSWLILGSSLPIVRAATRHSIDNPEQSTLVHVFEREKRKLRMQGIMNKIDDRNIRDLLKSELDDLSTYLL